MTQHVRGGSSPQIDPHAPGLYRRCDFWREYTEAEQIAVAALLLPIYVAKATNKKTFAVKRKLDPASDECESDWQAALAEWARLLRRSYTDLATVYTVFLAVPGGRPIALATAMVEFGSRDDPFGGAVGDNNSSIQTFRLLTGFTFPADLGLNPHITPERAVAEEGRVCVQVDAELNKLEEARLLTHAGREYIRQKGSREVISGAFFGALAHADADVPPRRIACLVINTPPRLADYLRTLPLPLQPLYLERGAEPTARAVNGPELVSGYFTWRLPDIVPAGMGLAQGVHFLATTYPEVLRQCPWSLPYFLLNDEHLRTAMRGLWDACALGQDPPPVAWDEAAD